jgi:homogentisate 1,2-dioxygenase
MHSASFALPSAERWLRPSAPSWSAATLHPGRFLHGPDPKLGDAGLTAGLAPRAAAEEEKARQAVERRKATDINIFGILY